MSDSERLRHLIEARGLTLTAIAAELDVAVSTVSCWVGGTREPREETLPRFAEVLGLTTAELTDLLPRRDRRETHAIALPERSRQDPSAIAAAAGRPVDDVAADLLGALFPGRHDTRGGRVELDLPEASWETLRELAAPLEISAEELCARILEATATALAATKGPGRALLEALMVARVGVTP